MIPADIDNFIIESINVCRGKYIIIRGSFSKIPRKIGNCYLLKNIYLHYFRIVDISAISNCYSLVSLNLCSNKIVDISALSTCSSLSRLYLYNNKIVNKIKFNPKIKV